MIIHRFLITLACLLLPADQRPARREQWLADLRDCSEVGLPAHQISLGALRAVATTPTKGTVMLPIGPLALGLRLRRNGAAAPLALIMIMLLAIGIGLLVI
jgi:hypothetical protein